MQNKYALARVDDQEISFQKSVFVWPSGAVGGYGDG
ncbi:hypothetical protein CCACVL1_10967 [Corchorus capsularis]|uniref:Uncharacterized protein n=1 Tax=Corchorus capsularis TaxID=210143 RepID=A0A1R3INN5_COCAP|nr:hypothetical protein CCACVL1_10967 [Corchorus capsularis]